MSVTTPICSCEPGVMLSVVESRKERYMLSSVGQKPAVLICGRMAVTEADA